MPEPAQAKIFISHRSTDCEVAKALCDLIQSAYKLDEHDIVCPSSGAHGIDNGTPSYSELKKQLTNAQLVIYLISEEFCNSEDCHYEIAWGVDLPSSFFFHLDGVTSSVKPRCVTHLSMNNLDNAGMAKLRLHLNKILHDNVNEHIWSTKSSHVLTVFSQRPFKATLEEKNECMNGNKLVTSETDKINDYIKRCANSACIMVFDNLEEIDESIARIGNMVFVPKAIAWQLRSKNKYRVPNIPVVPVYMLRDMHITDQGIALKKGKIYPTTGPFANTLIENGYAIQVDSAEDVAAAQAKINEQSMPNTNIFQWGNHM